MKKYFFIALFLALTLANPSTAFGIDFASFPSCIAPSGNLVANYDSGTHGIAGVGSRIGKDTVYSQGEGNVMQCFCGSDGEGIQSNWLYAGNLTPDEIKILENEGWIMIPDGSAWGLSQGAYLVKNINYSCNSTTTSGGDGRTDGLTDGRSDGLGSIVQSASGNLASTGNLIFIAQVFGLGAILTAIGLAIRFRSR